MISKRRFHYTVVLGIIHGRIILNNDPYDLLSFLTGKTITLQNYNEARTDCLDYLLRNFPKLGNIHVIEAFKELDKIQEGDTLCIAMAIEIWLTRNSNIFLCYNEMIEVEKIESVKKAKNLAFLHKNLKELGLN